MLYSDECDVYGCSCVVLVLLVLIVRVGYSACDLRGEWCSVIVMYLL